MEKAKARQVESEARERDNQVSNLVDTVLDRDRREVHQAICDEKGDCWHGNVEVTIQNYFSVLSGIKLLFIFLQKGL